MKKCIGCGKEISDDSVFCNFCGTKQEVICSSCGKANPAGSSFCNKCGGKMDANSVSTGNNIVENANNEDNGREVKGKTVVYANKHLQYEEYKCYRPEPISRWKDHVESIFEKGNNISVEVDGVLYSIDCRSGKGTEIFIWNGVSLNKIGLEVDNVKSNVYPVGDNRLMFMASGMFILLDLNTRKLSRFTDFRENDEDGRPIDDIHQAVIMKNYIVCDYGRDDSRSIVVWEYRNKRINRLKDITFNNILAVSEEEILLTRYISEDIYNDETEVFFLNMSDGKRTKLEDVYNGASSEEMRYLDLNREVLYSNDKDNDRIVGTDKHGHVVDEWNNVSNWSDKYTNYIYDSESDAYLVCDKDGAKMKRYLYFCGKYCIGAMATESVDVDTIVEINRDGSIRKVPSEVDLRVYDSIPVIHTTNYVVLSMLEFIEKRGYRAYLEIISHGDSKQIALDESKEPI